MNVLPICNQSIVEGHPLPYFTELKALLQKEDLRKEKTMPDAAKAMAVTPTSSRDERQKDKRTKRAKVNNKHFVTTVMTYLINALRTIATLVTNLSHRIQHLVVPQPM